VADWLRAEEEITQKRGRRRGVVVDEPKGAHIFERSGAKPERRGSKLQVLDRSFEELASIAHRNRLLFLTVASRLPIR
jgi:hypothetical protein